MKRFPLLLVALFAVLVLPLRAQDESVDDKTFLENWLEKNLSSAGREVTVTGFAGALSSRATMDRLTIADDDGVWFILEGAELDWTRSALLTGRLEIDALRAKRIEVSRRPAPVAEGPSATASDFALPELPVSINIGRIAAERVELGAGVLGVPAVLRLEGEGWLNGGEGEARLALDRIDGGEGRFAIAADYANASRVLGLDLALAEGAGGIVAMLTGLPGAPPIDLTLDGRGPIDSFTAELDLATDGETRLGGQLTLAPGDRAAPGAPEGHALAFEAELAGDPGALFAPDYRAFFGPDTRLGLAGQRAPDGLIRIDRLDIVTDALRLAGAATIGANGWPERARIEGEIVPPVGQNVVLPIGGAQTRIAGAELGFGYDEASGDAWTIDLAVTGLERDGLALQSAEVSGTGTLKSGRDGTAPAVAGRLDIRAEGLASEPGSPAGVLGERLTGRLDFSRTSGEPLRLSGIDLAGADFRLEGALALETDTTRLDLIAEGDVTLTADNLARFAPLAGQPLTGAAALGIAGRAALPGGPFDVTVDGTGRDLGIGRPELDRLFAGESRLALAAARDGEGTRIERLALDAPGARAEASGRLAPGAGRIDARLDLPDAALLAEGLSGPVEAEIAASEDAEGWNVAFEAAAPGGAAVLGEGRVALDGGVPGEIDGKASARIADLAAYSGLAGRRLGGSGEIAVEGSWQATSGAFEVSGTGSGNSLAFDLGAADALTGGASRIAFGLRRDVAGTLLIDRADLDTVQLRLRARGESTGGAPRIEAEARLADLAVLVPGFPGAVTASGTANLGDGGWQVSAKGTGPGGANLAASGTVAADGGRADLKLTGRAPLGLANDAIKPARLSGLTAYDLRLSGPFALASLSGTMRAEDARVSLPAFALALDPLRGSVSLSGGRATLDLSATAVSGGRIIARGPVALAAPNTADLTIRLDALRLTDPKLYDLTADGRLTLKGPLTGGAMIGGRVTLSEVELQVPETGVGVDANLEGLTHVGDRAPVRATRARAGLDSAQAGGGVGSGPVFGLDLTVRAPRAVFVRGRGLDAELGGVITLAGSTAEVRPQGGFSLIRGRLDLLGNRLTLTEGQVTMQGSLDPWLYLLAETQAEDVTVRIGVEGLASDPKVTFASSPALPEDEILARLVFGRGLDEISPFQALKLASAVATLSGRGGAGTIGRLRQGFGLDDLDVTTDEEGTFEARAGVYLSDRVYTDVTVGADGTAEINLNLDISRSITAKGSVSSDGNTGIGLFFEKDY